MSSGQAVNSRPGLLVAIETRSYATVPRFTLCRFSTLWWPSSGRQVIGVPSVHHRVVDRVLAAGRLPDQGWCSLPDALDGSLRDLRCCFHCWTAWRVQFLSIELERLRVVEPEATALLE